MKTLTPCEFRDLDGSYALVRPLDDVRCRVIDSNVFEKGKELHLRDAACDWREGSEDIGGCTRVSLEDLFPFEDSLAERPAEDLLPLFAHHQESTRDRRDADPDEQPTHLGSFAPEDDGEDNDDFDFDTALRRLVLHYAACHMRLKGKSPSMDVCRCAGIAPASEWARRRLYLVASLTLAVGKYLSLPQLIMAMGELGMTTRLMD